ncbi:RNA-binding domain-containing protein [Periconia macrospinosa]|uniref:RNA-binding domain-containing protein n=1 Tax=Periconia macrospinosa TaxID=97972 RepID=A0A2V1D1R2_9PLEO|nr:RNA-binding domain-containing protein [Periconia macrospinosa]
MAESSNWRSARPAQREGNPYPPSSTSSWRRGDRSNRGPQQRDPRSSTRNRPEDLTVHRPERQQDDPATAEAIAEGRRIYLGNLMYSATPEDVERLLEQNNLIADYKSTHISVDHFTGRNPGYCFIEFGSKEAAEAAMATLEGVSMFNRPVKCRPCLPKGAVRRVDSDGAESRWGDWNGSSGGARSSFPSKTYHERSKAQEEGRQVYVGGLPRMLDQAENDVEMRDVFEGFEIVTISKRISPKAFTAPGADERRNFCFVDFASPEQAKAAVDAVDGSEYRGATIKVSLAVPRSERENRNERY